MKKAILVFAALLPFIILSCKKDIDENTLSKNYIFKNQDAESIKAREIISKNKFRSTKNSRTINSLNFGFNPSGYVNLQYSGYPPYRANAYAYNYNNYPVTLRISGQASSLSNVTGTGYYYNGSNQIIWTIPAYTVTYLSVDLNFNWVEIAEKIEQIQPTFHEANWSSDIVYPIRSQ